MNEQEIDDFIDNLIKEMSDPLKNHPDKANIVEDIHEQLLMCKNIFQSQYAGKDDITKTLNIVFNLLQRKYEPVSYAAEFNTIYVDQRDGVAIDKIIEIINKVVLD